MHTTKNERDATKIAFVYPFLRQRPCCRRSKDT
jgi:hypothetical protein